MRANETAKEFLVFERPDVNVLVLTTHCEQRVVGAQRKASDVCLVVQRHQALGLVAGNVVQLD